MKIRWIDHLAFWAINHLLSRPQHQRFDPEAFTKFSKEWTGRRHDEFFSLPEQSSTTTHALERLSRLRHPSCCQLEFPTLAPSSYDRNNHVWVEFHLGHPLDKAPIFFVLHGWRSVSTRGYHNMCRRLNALGINAAILHLPYHYSRRPHGSFNGELAITSDIARSAHALRQAVIEIRWLKNLLKTLGAPHVGLWGTSYGAWVSALAITLDGGFDGALLLEPPVEIEALFWDTPLFSNLQKELHRIRIPREQISDLFRLVTPYHHALRIPADRVLILGSAHDPIGHPRALRRLHETWFGSYLEIFPYGHISYRLHTSAVDRFLSQLAPKLVNR